MNAADSLSDRRSISQHQNSNMEHARLSNCQTRNNGQKEKNVRNNMRPKLPCVVCTATTVYSYYGAIVCDPCRTFFRRQVMGQKKLECPSSRNCKIFADTRKNCSWCRFQKCLSVGMKPEMVEHDVVKFNGKKILPRRRLPKTNIDIDLKRNFLGNNTGNNNSLLYGNSLDNTLSKEVTPVVKQLRDMSSYSTHSNISCQPRSSTSSWSSSSSSSSSPCSALVPFHSKSNQRVLAQSPEYFDELGMDVDNSSLPPAKDIRNLLHQTIMSHGKHFQKNSWSSDNLLFVFSANILDESDKPVAMSHSSHLPAICPEVVSEKHDFIWVRKSETSQINLKILGIKGIPCHSHHIILEIEVNEGIVSGTTCVFEDLFKNEPPPDPNNDMQLNRSKLIFNSRFDHQTFYRNESQTSSSLFDVSIIDSHGSSTVLIESMTDDLWSRLSQVITGSRHLLRTCSAYYFRQPSSSCSFTPEIEEKKVLVISDSMDNFAVGITAAIGVFDFFRGLPPEDQVILLKEGMDGVFFLITTHFYSREYDSFILSAFQDQLFVGVEKSEFKMVPSAKLMDDAYHRILSNFYEFLRTDALLVCLICFIHFFQDTLGISSSKIVNDERKLMYQLLEKYISAKCQEWNMPYDDIWKNVQDVLVQADNFKRNQIYEVNAREQQRNFEKSKTMENQYMAVTPSHSCNLIYNALDLDFITFIFARAVIEIAVKNGIVVGTSLAFDDLVTGIQDVNTCNIDDDMKSYVTHKLRDGYQTSFHVRSDNLNQKVFDVEIFSCSTPIISIIRDMNWNLWDRLRKTVSAAFLFQRGCNATSFSLSSSTENSITADSEYEMKTVSVTAYLTTVVKTIVNLFDIMFPEELVEADKVILRREASMETLTILMVFNYDRTKDAVALHSLENQLILWAKTQVFKTIGADDIILDKYRSLMSEFQDVLRKDEIVMTLLCMLVLFKERSGLSNRELVQRERTFFVSLLDKYIAAKIRSNDWIIPYDVIWDFIHRDMARVSSVKSLIENLNLPQDQSRM